jgi:hypothetical protein
VSHLQCPECRLTVPAAAYYLRGDQCPRCMTAMLPYSRPRPAAAPATPARATTDASAAREQAEAVT